MTTNENQGSSCVSRFMNISKSRKGRMSAFTSLQFPGFHERLEHSTVIMFHRCWANNFPIAYEFNWGQKRDKEGIETFLYSVVFAHRKAKSWLAALHRLSELNPNENRTEPWSLKPDNIRSDKFLRTIHTPGLSCFSFFACLQFKRT